MKMFRIISNCLYPVLLGPELIRSMERNVAAAERLDAAIRDMLARGCKAR